MKVELKGIHKAFGKVCANSDVSLTVAAGSIHGLLGENGAGKSTLVKILSGFITCDCGEILLDHQPVKISTPADAIAAGIGMLHQDPLDFAPLSVLDNFMAGKKAGGFWLNRRTAAQELSELAAQFNFDLSVNTQVSDLTVGERQQLELLRLLSLGVQTLILDEPTTGISASQKAALFEALQQLAAQGKSIIFVSHKLEDVEKLCDRVTVMRQGQVVGHVEVTHKVTESAASQLVTMMFGRELAIPSKPKFSANSEEHEILRLHDLEIISDRLKVTLEKLIVQRGEVIGLAGLDGSGQSLFLELCAGLVSASAGSIYIGDTDMTHRPYRQYLKAGVGYSPADRLKDGLISGLTIHEHITLRNPAQGFLINWSETLKTTQAAISTYSIRGNSHTKVEKLSGGNQQRTQLALLSAQLNLLLMEQPTRGLDIESSLWVWQQLLERTRQGTAILFASPDLDEIMQYSDRILVFSGGQVSEPIDAETLTADRLGQMIGGKLYLKQN